LTKSAREIMEILESFDLTRYNWSAAQLAGCDPKTVARLVTIRDAGADPYPHPRRPRLIDPFLEKIEELVERSNGAAAGGQPPRGRTGPSAHLPVQSVRGGGEVSRMPDRYTTPGIPLVPVRPFTKARTSGEVLSGRQPGAVPSASAPPGEPDRRRVWPDAVNGHQDLPVGGHQNSRPTDSRNPGGRTAGIRVRVS
jgi:hypothetical protein